MLEIAEEAEKKAPQFEDEIKDLLRILKGSSGPHGLGLPFLHLNLFVRKNLKAILYNMVISNG